MKKYYLVFILLFAASALFFSVKVAADDDFAAEPTAEAAPAASAEVSVTSPEASSAITAEATALSTKETFSITSGAATAEVTTAAPEEGSIYKGVPWGADFGAFKAIKGFAGSLAPFSAAFMGSLDDNDIALLLGVPVSDKGSNGGQRVMFEYVPQKFSSVYFEPDDTHYIFYNGKLVMTFSRINEKNFDLYRDTFYKKYKKAGSLTKRYEPAPKKLYLLQAGIFEKGKTTAFLIKSQVTVNNKDFLSTKLVYAQSASLNAIRKEIEDRMAADKLSTDERDKKMLEKDLLKIE